MNKAFQELIRKQLHPESKLLIGVEDEFVFDLDKVIGLINNIHSDPTESMTLLLNYSTALNMMIAKVREDRETVGIAKEQYYSSRYKLYSQNDEENPYYKKAKLTIAFVESLINDDDQYITLKKEYNRLDAFVSRLYAVKNSVDEVIQLARLLVENPDRLPSSGVVVESEVIRQQVAKFRDTVLNDD